MEVESDFAENVFDVGGRIESPDISIIANNYFSKCGFFMGVMAKISLAFVVEAFHRQKTGSRIERGGEEPLMTDDVTHNAV